MNSFNKFKSNKKFKKRDSRIFCVKKVTKNSLQKLKNSTLFIDIDGTLVKHYMDSNGKGTIDQISSPVVVLPGVKEKFSEWKEAGYYIVLTTARSEKFRRVTENQLKSLGLWWNQLVMNLMSGERYIINDLKPNDPFNSTAIGINLLRNSGLEDVDLELARKSQNYSLLK